MRLWDGDNNIDLRSILQEHLDAVEALPAYPEPLPSYLRDEDCGDCFFEASDHCSNQNCSDEHADLEVPWSKFVFFFFPGGLSFPQVHFQLLQKSCSFHS